MLFRREQILKILKIIFIICKFCVAYLCIRKEIYDRYSNYFIIMIHI